jgi:hypothetical protein
LASIYLIIKMKELAQSEFSPLLKRFPPFELSYEIMTHKKVLSEPEKSTYDICFAIPVSKKYILWFTFYEDRDVCILMELNRDKRIVRMQIPTAFSFPKEFSLGTVLYGSCILEGGRIAFLAEDILWYRGIQLQTSLLNERLSFLRMFFQLLSKDPNPYSFRIAFVHIFRVEDSMDISNVSYDIHHMQYRSFSKVAPYMNMPKPSPVDTMKSQTPSLRILPPPFRMNMGKPQYREITVFQVSADLAFDIYHLYAYGKANTRIYYGLAYINGYKTSVFMNSLFRKMKENQNLDLIEESDDEEEFQDQREDRFVDLGKTVAIECQFSPKFKRWIPLRLAHRSAKIIHICML